MGHLNYPGGGVDVSIIHIKSCGGSPKEYILIDTYKNIPI